VRGQREPEAWPETAIPAETSRSAAAMLDGTTRDWVRVADAGAVPLDGGIAVRYGEAQLAVFHFARGDKWFGTQNMCPHKRDMVLARGILGDQSGAPKVACPQHKKTFSLETGACLGGDDLQILTFPARAEQGGVFLFLPPAETLAAALAEGGACALAGACSEVRK
jgi:NAD(P)H-dependent nitrite reductase small subunit